MATSQNLSDSFGESEEKYRQKVVKSAHFGRKVVKSRPGSRRIRQAKADVGNSPEKRHFPLLFSKVGFLAVYGRGQREKGSEK